MSLSIADGSASSPHCEGGLSAISCGVSVFIPGTYMHGLSMRRAAPGLPAPMTDTASSPMLGYVRRKAAPGIQAAHRDAADVLGLVRWVLPGLRQHAVVPVDVVRVEAQLPLLRVLLDGRLLLVLRRQPCSPSLNLRQGCSAPLKLPSYCEKTNHAGHIACLRTAQLYVYCETLKLV